MINKDNYQAILTSMLENKQSFEVGEDIFFEIKNRSLHYHNSGRFLGGLNCSNDSIFKLLEVDPIIFCSNIYGYQPRAGIFPETTNPMALVNCVYALFQACDVMNGETNIKEVALNNVKSSLFDGFVNETKKKFLEELPL